MEVLLLEASGLPQGSLLSMRAGASRRQAAVDGRQEVKMRLPCGLSAVGPLHFELLAPVGSAVLELQPGIEQYPVSFGQQASKAGAAAGRVTFQVREEMAPTGSPSASPPTSARDGGRGGRRHLAALEEQGYLEAHGLLPWVQDVLQALLRERPADPWAYIGERSSEAQRQAQPSADPAAGSRRCATEEAREAAAFSPSSSSTAASPARKRPSPADLSSLRAKLRSVLGEAAGEGRLAPLMPRAPDAASEEVLGGVCPSDTVPAAASASSSSAPAPVSEAATPDLQDIRARLRGSLTGGVASGSLRQALSQSAQDDRARLRALFSAAAKSGRLASALQAGTEGTSPPPVSAAKIKAGGMMRLPPESTWALAYAPFPEKPPSKGGSVQDSRQRLRALLSKAAKDGSLSRGLSSTSRPQTPVQPAQPATEPVVEKAAAEGKGLMQLPPSSTWALAYASPLSPHSKRDLRSHLRLAFSSATLDGRLERILEEGSEAEDELEQPRSEASCSSQKSPMPSAEEELRAHFRRVLATAALDGRLEEALEDGRTPREAPATDVPAARAKLRQLLSGGASDGRLRGLLQDTETPAAPTSEGAAVEASGLQGTRAKLRGALSGAATDGSLAACLDVEDQSLEQPAAAAAASPSSEVEEASSQARVAGQVRVLLAKAATDGRLADALRSMDPGQSPQDSARAAALGALARAADSGLLRRLLQEQRQQRVAAAACNLLGTAADGGQLAKALQEASSSRQSPAAPQAPEPQSFSRADFARSFGGAAAGLEAPVAPSFSRADFASSFGWTAAGLEAPLAPSFSRADFASSFGGAAAGLEAPQQDAGLPETLERARKILVRGATDGSLAAVLSQERETEPVQGQEHQREAEDGPWQCLSSSSSWQPQGLPAVQLDLQEEAALPRKRVGLSGHYAREELPEADECESSLSLSGFEVQSKGGGAVEEVLALALEEDPSGPELDLEELDMELSGSMPSPTHSEGSSVAMLRELLVDDAPPEVPASPAKARTPEPQRRQERGRELEGSSSNRIGRPESLSPSLRTASWQASHSSSSPPRLPQGQSDGKDSARGRSRQHNPAKQEEFRPNTAERQLEAVREVFKDIAGIGESGDSPKRERATPPAMALATERTAAAKPKVPAPPSAAAPPPEAVRPGPPKSSKPGSALVSGFKRLTAPRTSTLPANLQPLGHHSSAHDRLKAMPPAANLERDPVWVENEQLRRRREGADASSVSFSENEKLRTNLGKLLSFRRKEPFPAAR